MKVYVAASFKNREGAIAAREALINSGHSVTSRWIDGIFFPPSQLSDEQLEREALMDLEDIVKSDAMLFINTPEIQSTTGGQHLEMGYTLGLGKPIYFIGPKTSVFHAHPLIVQLASAKDL